MDGEEGGLFGDVFTKAKVADDFAAGAGAEVDGAGFGAFAGLKIDLPGAQVDVV